jgi:Spy/CpxP family protein refolding chaperone
MRLLIAFALLAGIVLITGNGLLSQEKKDPPTKIKGTLPAGWKALDLTGEQKQQIYKISIKYKEEITKMEDKIKEMRAEERREMVKILTDDQKKKLADIATGGDSTKPKDGEKPKDAKN